MKTPSSVAAVLTLTCLCAAPVLAEDPAAPPAGAPAAASAVQPIDPNEIHDVCAYVQDVVEEQFKGNSAGLGAWKACDPVDQQKVAALKASDPAYAQYLAAAAPRKQQATELARRLTSKFPDVKDDSDKRKSMDVWEEMTFLDISKGTQIDPKINERTFTAWLPAEQVKQVFPYWVIARNQQLRNDQSEAKSVGLKAVPTDADQKKAFCSDAAHKSVCERYDELEQNKVRLVQMKGIKDPNAFAQFIGEGWQREADGAIPAGATVGSGAGASDPSLAGRPKQHLRIAGVPEPYTAGSLDHAKLSGNTVGAGPVQVDTGWVKWALGASGGSLLGVGLFGALKGARKEIGEQDDMPPTADHPAAPTTAAAGAPATGRYGNLSGEEEAAIDRARDAWKQAGGSDTGMTFSQWFGTGAGAQALGTSSGLSTNGVYRDLIRKLNNNELTNLPTD